MYTDQAYEQLPRTNDGTRDLDTKLRGIVCEVLSDAPHLDVSGISVTVVNSEVTLTGRVCDRRTKYAVEDWIENRVGVTDIHNQLQLVSAAFQDR